MWFSWFFASFDAIFFQFIWFLLEFFRVEDFIACKQKKVSLVVLPFDSILAYIQKSFLFLASVPHTI